MTHLGSKAALAALCGLLAGCQVAGDAGCVTYGIQRASMPHLADGPVDAWVARTDSAMTGACR